MLRVANDGAAISSLTGVAAGIGVSLGGTTKRAANGEGNGAANGPSTKGLIMRGPSAKREALVVADWIVGGVIEL